MKPEELFKNLFQRVYNALAEISERFEITVFCFLVFYNRFMNAPLADSLIDLINQYFPAAPLAAMDVDA
jgi:hypothetical protein